MTTTTTSPTGQQRPPFWRDIRVLRVGGQVLAVLLVGFGLWWLFNNLVSNTDRLGITIGFDFLGEPTQFQIPYHSEFNPRSPVRDMVLVGIKNTFLAGLGGIILASILGLLIGVGRLSENWLIRRLCSLYVEFFRNIPPLVIIIFFAFAVFLFGPLPVLREASIVKLPGSANNLLILGNEEFGVPSVRGLEGAGIFGVIMIVALVVAGVVWWWRTRLNERTGAPHHRVLWFLGTVLAIGVVAYLALSGPIEMSWPAQSENRRRIVGGFAINAGFMSVTGALALYTASHVAEIIRGSILAVARGQTEASQALALTSFQRYRFVVLPQALRIALPPYINQCLNLVKNTSLAAAVGYSEITNLTQASIGNGRPAIPSIAILMLVYLAFSLIISLILNVVNRRLSLATR